MFIVLGALALLIPGPVVFCCRRRSKSESDGSWRKPERKERQKRGPGFVTGAWGLNAVLGPPRPGAPLGSELRAAGPARPDVRGLRAEAQVRWREPGCPGRPGPGRRDGQVLLQPRGKVGEAGPGLAGLPD